MSIILILFLLLILIYCAKDRKKINSYIQSLIKSKMAYLNNSKQQQKRESLKLKDLKNKSNQTKMKNISQKSKFNQKSNNNKNKNKIINKKNNINKKNKNGPPKKNEKIILKKNKKLADKIKNSKLSTNINSNTNLISSKSMKKINKKNKLGININIIPINSLNYGKSLSNNKLIKTRKNNIQIYKTKYSPNTLNTAKDTRSSDIKLINKSYNNLRNLNDEELNSLEYELAIMCDKRTYFQYYWSLLKKKQLILFTFLPANDYNLFSLKIALFLISFSLYFTINGFFFSDETMHKIHESNGAFDIVYQIPQILYSSVVSAIINMILKMLSLSEKNILLIKQEKDVKIAINKSKKIEKCLSMKFLLFFIISTIFLIFFWYFISCFCAVYTNTQMVLIKDTLVSFAISMIYPIGINLLPGLFRIPALRSKTKNKKCLYKASRLIAFI